MLCVCLQLLFRHLIGQVDPDGIFLCATIRHLRRTEEIRFRQHRAEHDVERGSAPFVALQENGAIVLSAMPSATVRPKLLLLRSEKSTPVTRSGIKIVPSFSGGMRTPSSRMVMSAWSPSCVTVKRMRSPCLQRSVQLAMMLSSIRWMSAVSSAQLIGSSGMLTSSTMPLASVIGWMLSSSVRHSLPRSHSCGMNASVPSYRPEAVEALSVKRSSR